MSDLTDEDLARIRRIGTRDDADYDDLVEVSALAMRAVEELRRHRAGQLSREERFALEELLGKLRPRGAKHDVYIALLDRLLDLAGRSHDEALQA